MAVTWGTLASAANSRMYAGIDVQTTNNGNGTGYYLVVRFYVRSDWNITDNMSGVVSGSGLPAGGASLGTYLMDGNPVTREVYVLDLGWQNTSCAGGPSYSWAISTSGQWQGANPSHSRGWTVPPHPAWAPLAPVSNPAATDITQTSATVSWGASANAYCHAPDLDQLQVSTSSSFATTVHDSQVGGNSRSVTGLSPGTTYYMRSRVHNAVGWSPWTSTTSFVTKAGMLVKVGGTWRSATPLVKVGGTWRTANTRVKVGGTWR